MSCLPFIFSLLIPVATKIRYSYYIAMLYSICFKVIWWVIALRRGLGSFLYGLLRVTGYSEECFLNKVKMP